MTTIIVQNAYPFIITPEKLARDTGLVERTRLKTIAGTDTINSQVIDGLIKNRRIPTVKIGKHRLVNLVELQAELATDITEE